MNEQQAIEQLESLKEHCKEWADKDEEYSIWDKDVQALDKAIEVLEKQIPKKVTKTYGTYNMPALTYGECPNCGHTGLKKEVHEHCWWCGQKLDWEE